jgi:hypothetical protein
MENFDSQEQNANHDLVALFVGKKIDYYRGKWAKAAQHKNGFSWNFAAFFLGPLWFLYRKMYWQGGLILAAGLIETAGELIFFPNMSEDMSHSLTRTIGIAVAVFCGMSGNSGYKMHVDKAVARLQAGGVSDESYRRQGGVSWLPPIAGFVVFMAAMFAIVFGLQ